MTTIPPLRVLFLGSFLQYSASVLKALHESPLINVVGVVTTPPMPAGRAQKLKKTDVHLLAEELNIPVATPVELTPETLTETAQQLHLDQPPSVLLTAGYGKLLPNSWLNYPSIEALNLHFSLLPDYRGANPAEWAILRNEKQTGITVITMNADFDTGGILAQRAIPILGFDTRETIYEKLYQLGGEMLPGVLTNMLTPRPQPKESPTPYAKRLQRADGFIGWNGIVSAMQGFLVARDQLSPTLEKIVVSETQVPSTYQGKDQLTFIAPRDVLRIIRALTGFPGVWTMIPTTKGEVRMKILSADLENDTLQLDKVQIAGQQPAKWNQVKTILASASE